MDKFWCGIPKLFADGRCLGGDSLIVNSSGSAVEAEPCYQGCEREGREVSLSSQGRRG